MGGQTNWETSQMGRGTGQMGQGTSRQMSQGTSGQMGREIGQMGAQMTREDQGLISPVTVRDVAATEVVTIQPDAPVSEAVQKMRREEVGSVVVVEGNRPIGIVTDRKIALAFGDISDASQLRAADLMSENLFTVPEGTNVFDLVRRLSDKGVRRIPVVGDQGDLQGIVSLDDVVVLLAEEFYNVSQIIRKQSPRF
jgi:CBS domain-containing protein